MPTDPVRFEAPDVRQRQIVDTVAEDPKVPTPWLRVSPGVAYEGLCSNSMCPIQFVNVLKGAPPLLTMCNMGFGKFRPNEDLHYKQIVCPACKAPFVPTRFFFQQCSAKINYCIAGDHPSVTTLSEDRAYKSRVFGQRGVHVVYSMLVIEVEKPNAFPERNELDLLTYNERALDEPNKYNNELYSLLDFIWRNRKQYMNPANISYTQDSISSKFQCGRLVKETMELLASNRGQSSTLGFQNCGFDLYPRESGPKRVGGSSEIYHGGQGSEHSNAWSVVVLFGFIIRLGSVEVPPTFGVALQHVCGHLEPL